MSKTMTPYEDLAALFGATYEVQLSSETIHIKPLVLRDLPLFMQWYARADFSGGEIGAEAVEANARVLEMLAAVGLPSEAADRYPHQFSGGQRQRISIARALAPRPQVLLADEPVSALDVSVRAQVLNLLNHLIADMGLTMIFVSHDLGVVRHVCDRVAVLKNGELVELGTTEEVYTNPQHAYTKSLLAAVPTLEYQPNRLATGWDGT